MTKSVEDRAARTRRRVRATAALAVVSGEQCGVVSYAQVLACGFTDSDLRRLMRRHELMRVHPRVYVDHTGPMTWVQRAWAAVLWADPAALCHESAVRIEEGPGRRRSSPAEEAPIHVVVEQGRRLEDQDGVVLHRMRHFDARVRPHRTPSRIAYDEAVLDLAAAAKSDDDAIARLADACGAHRTTGQRLLTRVEARSWLPRKDLIARVLDDVTHGTCSALEQMFLDRVVRPHGLPEGVRRVSHRHPGDSRYREVLLAAYELIIELDGRLFHDSSKARDDDMDRDLDRALDAVALDDLLTIRLSWGQSVDRACATAAKLEVLLRRRGWDGATTPCPACRVAA